MLRGLGADAVPVRRPSELDAIRGLIIPGGESTTMAKLLETSALDAPLRARLHDAMPTFGTIRTVIVAVPVAAGATTVK